MSRLVKLTTMAAVLIAGAVFTADADAGHCSGPSCRYSSPFRSFLSPRRPLRPLYGQRRGFAGPGIGGPAIGGPGVGGPGIGGPGFGGQGAAGGNQAVNVPVGATITLPGNRGTQAGKVNLLVSNVRLPLNVLEWNQNGVTVTLPDMQVNAATQAQIEIQVPGSNTAETVAIQLQPRPAVLIHNAPVVVNPPAPEVDMAPQPPQSPLAGN